MSSALRKSGLSRSTPTPDGYPGNPLPGNETIARVLGRTYLDSETSPP